MVKAKRITAADSKVYVAKSKIHGKGLFAAEKIPADTVVGIMQSKPTTKDGSYVLWLSKKKKIEITNEFKYINHSDDPNVALYDEEVVSLRKIKAFEELTHNYDG